MRVLILGGTGLISVGIVKHLLDRGATVTMFNRGQRDNTVSGDVEQLTGDRNDLPAFRRICGTREYDVVIDMIAFNPEQAQADVDLLGGRCQQLIFCSTVCTYGVKVPPRVLIDETFPQEPISGYGRNKVTCEQIVMKAHAEKKFNATIIRPSSTYGPGSPLIDQLEPDTTAWDRVERGLPVIVAGDGLGLWVSTHRDDCGKLFAYAALNQKTYGESYNATHDRQFTWRDLYRETAAALDTTAQLLLMPADWIVAHDPDRFGLLREITRYHGAYSSDKAKRDVPEFVCTIDYQSGAAETLLDVKRRGKWKTIAGDTTYDKMVDASLKAGVRPVDA